MSEPTFTAEQLREAAEFFRQPCVVLGTPHDPQTAAMLEFAARLVEREEFMREWLRHHIDYATSLRRQVEKQVAAFQSVLDDDYSKPLPEEPR